MRHLTPRHALAALVFALIAPSLHAAPFVYVGNYYTADVSVFDAPTRTLVATVPVGSQPFPIAVSPDGTRVVVGNGGSNSVSIIETAGHTVIATLGVGQNPYGIAINPAGTRAYVANYASADATIVDLTTNTVIKTLPLGTNPGGVAVNPQGTFVYVSLGGSNAIKVIDTATDTVTATIANAGISPWGIVFSPDGTRAYVANFSGANVSVINAVTHTLITQWPVGNSPVGIALNGDGSRLYTGNSASDTVSIVDTTAGFLLNNLPVGHRPFGVAADPDGRILYVTNAGNIGNPGSVSVFDGSANVVLATIPTAVFSGAVGNFVSPYTPPGVPTGLAATPGNAKATLTFTPPFSNGGRPITGYSATCGSQTRSGGGSPIVVDLLANGTTVLCTVYAINDRGNGTPTAPVNVTPANVPGAPSISGVMRGNASVTVSFAAPGSNGGAAISGYTATCGSASQSGQASPITVGGLANGMPVTCTVFASNASGDGAASSASAPVTPMTVPGAPTLLSAVHGPGGVILTFDAPADDGGGAVGNYAASCQPGNHTANGAQSPLIVAGTDVDSAYTCSVSASNDAGTGPSSGTVTAPPRPTTDLAVTVSNGTDYVRGDSSVVYTIAVSNLGANGVTGARIVDTPDAALQSPAWTCSATGGAQCPANGTGAIDFLANIPAGASLSIALTAHVAALPETPLSNSASVSTPAAWRDTDASNDTATDGPDVRGLFRSRFD